MRIGEWLAGSDDGSQIAFHQLWRPHPSATCQHIKFRWWHTLVEICLVEVLRPGDIHIIQTSDLRGTAHGQQHLGQNRIRPRQPETEDEDVTGAVLTLRCPRKCCSSLISRKARLAKIFLLKTLVTFLMATPSLVWLLTAALWAEGAGVSKRGVAKGGVRTDCHTIRCRKLPVPAPW